MKPKTMILMVVAVGCGLAASYMTSKLLADRNQPREEEKVLVVMAKTKVPRFAIMKEPEKFFEVREIPKSAAPRSFFTRLEEIKGKRVNKEIKVDVHISEEDVLDSRAALPLPDGGYVGVGMTITASSAVGYFVNPGDKVDVLLTQRGPNPSAQTILRDVLVLAVGQQATRSTDGTAGAIQANTVSVALTPEEAQLLRLAETQGDLSLMLRKDGDISKGTVRPATLRDLKRAGATVASLTSPTRKPGDPVGRDNGGELPVIPKELVKPETPKTTPKPETKTEPEEKEPVKPKPVWTVTIETGAAPPKVVNFYKRPDGSITKDESDPDLTDDKETKDTKESKETKKTEPKSAEQKPEKQK